jgi:hypothetical protein
VQEPRSSKAIAGPSILEKIMQAKKVLSLKNFKSLSQQYKSPNRTTCLKTAALSQRCSSIAEYLSTRHIYSVIKMY